MNRKKIFKILKRALAIGLISFTLLCSPFFKNITNRNVYANTNIPKIEYNINNSINNKRVLIYCSHSCEEYENGKFTVRDAAKDFCNKLNKRGINVTFLTSDFANMAGGYNYSYNNSRNQLQQLDLNNYDLILDYHRDAGNCRKTVLNKFGTESAKVCAVLSKNYNKNFNKNYKMIKSIKQNINFTYGNNIWKNDTIYNKGIVNGFNSDITGGILLEVGDNFSNFNDIKAANTELSLGISNFFNN